MIVTAVAPHLSQVVDHRPFRHNAYSMLRTRGFPSSMRRGASKVGSYSKCGGGNKGTGTKYDGASRSARTAVTAKAKTTVKDVVTGKADKAKQQNFELL